MSWPDFKFREILSTAVIVTRRWLNDEIMIKYGVFFPKMTILGEIQEMKVSIL